MTTRMVHPSHGATHAYNTNEVGYLQKLGWQVESEKAEEAAAVVLEAEIEGAIFDELVKRKPGRPAKAK